MLLKCKRNVKKGRNWAGTVGSGRMSDWGLICTSANFSTREDEAEEE
jgi:hypothetical protein